MGVAPSPVSLVNVTLDRFASRMSLVLSLVIPG